MALSLLDMLRMAGGQAEPGGGENGPQPPRRIRSFQREDGPGPATHHFPTPPPHPGLSSQLNSVRKMQRSDNYDLEQEQQRQRVRAAFQAREREPDTESSYPGMDYNYQELARRNKMERIRHQSATTSDDSKAREMEWDAYLAEQYQKSCRKQKEWERKRSEAVARAQAARLARLFGGNRS